MAEFYRFIVREQVLKLHRTPTACLSRVLLIRTLKCVRLFFGFRSILRFSSFSSDSKYSSFRRTSSLPNEQLKLRDENNTHLNINQSKCWRISFFLRAKTCKKINEQSEKNENGRSNVLVPEMNISILGFNVLCGEFNSWHWIIQSNSRDLLQEWRKKSTLYNLIYIIAWIFSTQF